MAETEKFDVFLCHNSEDKPEVEKIRKRLMEEGLRPWLDKYDFEPLRSFQDQLEEIIPRIEAVAVFIGSSGVGPWADMEIKAFLNQFAKRQIRIGLVILPGCPQKLIDEASIFIKDFHWVDFREQDPEPMGHLIWGITGLKAHIRSALRILEENFEYPDETLIKIYRQSLPRNRISSEEPSSWLEFVQELHNMRRGEFSSLERFMGYLKQQEKKLLPEHQGLVDRWLQTYLADSTSLLSSLKQEQKEVKSLQNKQKPCLLLGIFEESSDLMARAWLIEDIEQYDSEEGSGCRFLTASGDIPVAENQLLQDLQELLERFYKLAESDFSCLVKKVQISLPYRFVGQEIEKIDSWLLQKKKRFSKSYGIQCEVSVRFSERLKPIPDHDSLVAKEKWQLLQDQEYETAEEAIPPVENSSPDELFDAILDRELVAVRLAEIMQSSDQEDTMDALYSAGIPLALWIRSEAEGLECDEVLDNICRCCCWYELPEAIRQKRLKARKEKDHIGNHLSLLWDNPKLVPPKHLLKLS